MCMRKTSSGLQFNIYLDDASKIILILHKYILCIQNKMKNYVSILRFTSVCLDILCLYILSSLYQRKLSAIIYTNNSSAYE